MLLSLHISTHGLEFQLNNILFGHIFRHNVMSEILKREEILSYLDRVIFNKTNLKQHRMSFLPATIR